MSILVNRTDKNVLKQRLKEENIKRKTISFYRYVNIPEPNELRNELYKAWSEWNCFGRIYLAKEGINAQMSVPEDNWEAFWNQVNSLPYFKDMLFKHAVDGNGKSFYKLIVKVRDKIVADGIHEENFDPANTGSYLDAKGFNKAIEDENTIVIDMRNHYESEVGRFERAFCPDADTFREELPLVIDYLKGQEDKKVVMYCTGGIRCEKASAYFKHKGFKDVNHLKGGIIQYAQEIKEQNLESKFKGVNFVFDERIGERITEDILSECHQCGKPCDTHVNCKNDDCHLLFIQCEECSDKMNGCCTPECVRIAALPIEEQRELRKGRVKNGPECLSVYKSRLRPNLKEILKNNLSLK
ncbi:oxygen-dependent tRNA uridine(34) hydroxylase TrhO [Aurantibacillus circumpalustris]|uniref:oxygen-dependent tRNA uridine(34) hydroxylase TrhO n=1 Tax=Aurantibacillus circumpalustris TaxID=3036359 RepID=UPI00295AF95C|nr:rhodanese-related sulfurtransferase [Aurantibacillus circumpalustris]